MRNYCVIALLAACGSDPGVTYADLEGEYDVAWSTVPGTPEGMATRAVIVEGTCNGLPCGFLRFKDDTIEQDWTVGDPEFALEGDSLHVSAWESLFNNCPGGNTYEDAILTADATEITGTVNFVACDGTPGATTLTLTRR